MIKSKYYCAAAAAATLRAMADKIFDRQKYWIAPGGSSPIGALGHVNAAVELAKQIKQGGIPEPDVIVVGVGTCGTIAGLLTGFRYAGLKTKVIGVRCVDAIICNKLAIFRLCRKLEKKLGATQPISYADIDLRNPTGPLSEYARHHQKADETIQVVQELAGLELATTYTSKVALTLNALIETGELQNKRVLYWHTYSSKAFRSSSKH